MSKLKLNGYTTVIIHYITKMTDFKRSDLSLKKKKINNKKFKPEHGAGLASPHGHD